MEGIRDGEQRSECRRFDPAFELTDVGPMQTGLEREFFLRKTGFETELLQFRPKEEF